MRVSILFLGTAALVVATASPEPTAAPDTTTAALALAASLRERQVSGQLPGLSGSIGTDGGCGHVGPISGCFGAAGSQTRTQTVIAQASTTTTAGSGTTTTRTTTGTTTATGTKATSSSGAGAVRDYRRTSMGNVLVVVGLGAVSFAACMA